MAKYIDLSYADQLEGTWPDIGRARWTYRTHSVRQFVRRIWEESNNTHPVEDTLANRKAEVDRILKWWWEKKFYPTCYGFRTYSQDSQELADYMLKEFEKDSLSTIDNSHPPPRSY